MLSPRHFQFKVDKKSIVNIQLFLNNSLDDGLYVSKSVSKLPICSDKTPNCESIINKICIPFYCYDDMFLQYMDESTIFHSEALKNSNYSLVDVISKESDESLFSKHDDENYILELLQTVEKEIGTNYFSSYQNLILLAIFFVLN